jgi:hypothetical protein
MSQNAHEDHPFYGKHVLRDREQDYIRTLLKKYHHEPVSEELKQKVWDELMMEKYLGNITIPFRVVVRRDTYGKYPPHIEVILDTKV